MWAQVSAILWLRSRLTATIPTPSHKKTDNTPPGDPIKIKDKVGDYRYKINECFPSRVGSVHAVLVGYSFWFPGDAFNKLVAPFYCVKT